MGFESGEIPGRNTKNIVVKTTFGGEKTGDREQTANFRRSLVVILG